MSTLLTEELAVGSDETTFEEFGTSPSGPVFPPPQMYTIFPYVDVLLTMRFQTPINKRTAVPIVELAGPCCRRCIKRISS
jgi:hypothetical protein